MSSYLAMWGVQGSLRDTSDVWFAREFLAWPTPYWRVDWSTARCPQVNGDLGPPERNQYDLVERHDPQACLAGARVIFDNGTERLIWVLTGDYDATARGHLGRWPD